MKKAKLYVIVIVANLANTMTKMEEMRSVKVANLADITNLQEKRQKNLVCYVLSDFLQVNMDLHYVRNVPQIRRQKRTELAVEMTVTGAQPTLLQDVVHSAMYVPVH